MIINNKAHFRPSPLRLALVMALSTLLLCQAAQAADINLQLPEQSLSSAISAVAQQGQVQVLYDAAALKNLRSPALQGQYSAQAALQQLLIGSGMELVNQGQSYVIRPLATSGNALMLPVTDVTGEGRAHPINDVMSAPQYITSEEIRQRGTGDGNVTELLKSNPAVQFANGDSTSMNQGEIKPSRISIHGANSYQNAYKLDGVSFNNDMDPANSGLGETITRVDTGDQGMYLDSRLIDSVTVYDNNVPVEYGGFTGGSIDVTSRRWQGENSAHAFYRETRSSWNKSFTDPDLNVDTSKNDTSNPARFQPKYNKMNFGGWFEAGITENSGLVFSASRRNSNLPMYSRGAEGITFDNEGNLTNIEQAARYRSQTRTSDNFFGKYSWNISERTTLDFSSNYSTYTSSLFSSSVLNSGYDNDHRGLSFTGQLNHQFDGARLELTTSYQQLEDKRTNDAKDYIELVDYSDWRNPVNLRSGGQGDLKTTQNTLSTKGVLRIDPFYTGNITHRPTLGYEVNSTKGQYQRDKDFYRYKFEGTKDGLEWLSYSSHTTRFLAGKASADYTNYALFADDELIFGRLTVRPGVRLDRDDFVNQNNIAPRLSSSYDLFGSGETLLIAGANRYYGRSMLNYALYGAQNAGMENCYFYCSLDPSENDWDGVKDYEGLDTLKTPYNDELTLALQQQIMSSTWRLQYVHRMGRDEVRSRTKYPDSGRDQLKSRIRTFDNGGHSTHDTLTLSMRNSQPWEWARASHVLTSSISWQQTKSNTPRDQGYAFFDPSTKLNSDKVWYNGKVINASDLPSTNFNSPLRLNLELTSVWDDYRITLFNRLQWDGPRSQAIRFENAYHNDPVDGQMLKYEKQRFSSKFNWDSRVTWQPQFAYGASISVEVNNVLNNRNVTDRFVYEDQVIRSYDPGRQFWLQLSYDL